MEAAAREQERPPRVLLRRDGGGCSERGSARLVTAASSESDSVHARCGVRANSCGISSLRRPAAPFRPPAESAGSSRLRRLKIRRATPIHCASPSRAFSAGRKYSPFIPIENPESCWPADSRLGARRCRALSGLLLHLAASEAKRTAAGLTLHSLQCLARGVRSARSGTPHFGPATGLVLFALRTPLPDTA